MAQPDRGPDEEDDVGSWVMAVEVTPSELVAVEVGRGTGTTPRPRTEALEAGPDPVDALADAFERVLAATPPHDDDRPARLVVATPADTERRRFEEIAEASALVGLPAPSWLPGPVAVVGARIAAEVEIGGRAVVLDGRAGGLTAWPVVRTADGAEVGGRGPVATGTRLDQLLLGVVRAQMRSLDPTAVSGAPRPDSRGPAGGDARGDAARLRREVRRARARLADEDVEEVRVTTGGPTVTVDRAVFDQLVEHALRETTTELAGPGGDDAPVHVLVDRPSPLATRLVALTQSPGSAASEPVLPGDSHDGVLGLAALLLPARPRPTRAASGAQAIRARRTVGPPTPVPVGAGRGSGSSGASGSAGAFGSGSGPGTGGPPEPPTPPRGTPVPDSDQESENGADEPRIPAARVPSTPVRAQRRSEQDEVVARPAHGVGSMMAFGSGADTGHTGGHAVLAEAAPHEARPVSDAPPGGSYPVRPVEPEPEQADGTEPSAAARTGRRGPDTAPQPIAAPGRATTSPRGAIIVLALLVVVAVLAAAGVLVIGPDQIGAAFGGLGTGTIWFGP